MNNKAILLMGATATGKTDLALKLATQYPIEIISVDSALIYTGMDIGTAKPTPEELKAVPHNLINIITPLELYSVAQFLQDTNQIIRGILSRGNLPILVGGTMMYYNALLNGISQLPEANPKIRMFLEERITTYGLNALYDELSAVDIESANKININDKQRIMRAMEVYYIANTPMSVLQRETNINLVRDISLLPLAIVPEHREVLHNRINLRFDKMLENGFITEVIELRDKYPELTINHTSMRSVGYYQVWQYLDNHINLTELSEMGKAATRQLAKRQITWLRSMNVINLAHDSFDLSDMFTELKLHIDHFLDVLGTDNV